PPTPSSTRKRASSFSTSSATPRTTGGIGKFPSGASILFCSPFCTNQPSRTGERGSAERRPGCRDRSSRGRPDGRQDADGQAGRRVSAGAANEQRLQRGVLARRSLTRLERPKKSPSSTGFFLFLELLGQGDVLGDRHFLRAPLGAEGTAKTLLLQPLAEAMP